MPNTTKAEDIKLSRMFSCWNFFIERCQCQWLLYTVWSWNSAHNASVYIVDMISYIITSVSLSFWLFNRNKGKSDLACALKTHRYHSTYVGIVQKNNPPPHIDHPTYLWHHPNHGTIVPPIRMKTMASMVDIPWWKPRDILMDASFCVYPSAFR